MNSKPKISIITVCYNSEKNIASTIESVLNQNYQNLEYILIDGSSSDSTVDIIRTYETTFKEKGIEYKWVSEKDFGIYDAMNKGEKISSGQWLSFMNSGDRYYDENVIKNIFGEVIQEDMGIIFGDIQLVYSINKKVKKQNRVNKNYFLLNMINHQSMFIKKDAYEKVNGYDIFYKYCADKDLVMKILFEENYLMKYLDIMVAEYDMLGVSSKNFLKVWQENRRIVIKYYPMYLILFKDSINCLRYIKKRLKGELK